jgi:hypothetical protein
MKVLPTDKIKRRVYGYFKNNIIQYIGSSYCALSTLENNHRKWKEKYGDQGHTHFRYNLTDTNLREGEFRTLLEEYTDQRGIEDLEGKLIRAFKPPYNIDYNPVNTSLKKKRY